jgi:hypothetical protein
VGRGRRASKRWAGLAVALVATVAMTTACVGRAAPTYATQRVHVDLQALYSIGTDDTSPIDADMLPLWFLSNADGSVQRSTATDTGFDFTTPADADDYWLWTGLPEHMTGVRNDSDGLQRAGIGCPQKECIHLAVGEDGSVRLPNKGDEVVHSLFVDFTTIHSNDVDRSDLPSDSPPRSPKAHGTTPTTS